MASAAAGGDCEAPKVLDPEGIAGSGSLDKPEVGFMALNGRDKTGMI